MKKYDYNFKISVVEAYKNGLTCQEIREKFHVTKTCFYDWLKLRLSPSLKSNPSSSKNAIF